tara:strand:- start:799 stop:1980 length:1182 start_codon:yes stop_codon:yes gene_type:complete
LPQISGSSIRSRDILLSQKEKGLHVMAITSPFQDSIIGAAFDSIHDITYYRTSKTDINSISDQQKSIFTRIGKFFSISTFTVALYKLAKKERPQVIHAHAMFYCGIPSIIVGKMLQIPVVYEFRSLWMFQRKETTKNSLEKYTELVLLKIEAFALRKANHAVFLNEKLRAYFIEKGYSFKKSSIINNAINTTLIQSNTIATPQKKDKEIVFGYIGTLTTYEGIEFLIEVFQELADQGHVFKLLLYGGGISEDSIVQKINQRSDLKNIVFKGRIASEKIIEAFAEIDVIVNPRLSNNITNSVMPLKPLEAFAYKKLVLGSDVGGIKEIITDTENGLLFRAENKQSLKDKILEISKMSSKKKETIIHNALDYVIDNKSWIKNVENYIHLYNTLLH